MGCARLKIINIAWDVTAQKAGYITDTYCTQAFELELEINYVIKYWATCLV